MALTSRVIIPDFGSESAAENIFSSSLERLFTDYTANAHGDPGTVIIYKSPRFGDIKLEIPVYPDENNDRLLFAHCLWNAAVIAAEAIESAAIHDCVGEGYQNLPSTAIGDNEAPPCLHWDSKYWNVKGADVLELGAGTALPSIISRLSGAKSLTITDHPSSPAIRTGTVAKNIVHSLSNQIERTKRPIDTTAIDREIVNNTIPPNVSIYGYLWGTTTFHHIPAQLSTSTQNDLSSYNKTTTIINNNNDDDDATTKISTLPQQPTPHMFTKIIIADCLWIPSKHSSILATMNTYLSRSDFPSDPISSSVPCALIIAGHHTGRHTTNEFFALATKTHQQSGSESHYDQEDDESESTSGQGNFDIAQIFEVDIDGRRREWVSDRVENRDEDKRWCVCAVLVRKDVLNRD